MCHRPLGLGTARSSYPARFAVQMQSLADQNSGFLTTIFQKISHCWSLAPSTWGKKPGTSPLISLRSSSGTAASAPTAQGCHSESRWSWWLFKKRIPRSCSKIPLARNFLLRTFLSYCGPQHYLRFQIRPSLLLPRLSLLADLGTPSPWAPLNWSGMFALVKD